LKRVLAIFLIAAASSDLGAAVNDFGVNGLIKMPNARMAVDGTLRVTVATDEVADLYNVTFQALPKVQATFRYTIFNPDDLAASVDVIRDRSYEIKAQLVEERRWLPAISVGVRDLLGTGAWEAEYLVASRAWGGLDVSVGMGWGRLGSRDSFDNPLGLVSDRFDTRPKQGIGGAFGGESRGKSFFRGNASFFGGAAYRFSRYPVTLIAEYESDQYDREVALRTLVSPSPVNVAFAWEPVTDVSVRLSWLRQDTLGITFFSQLNAKKVAPRKTSKRPAAISLDTETGMPKGFDPSSWYDRMVFASEQTGLDLRSGKLAARERTAFIEISNRDYNLTADALNQVMSIAERNLPDRVTSLDILLEENGLIGPTVAYRLQRDDYFDSTARLSLRDAYEHIKILEPRKLDKPTNKTSYDYPNYSFGVDLAAKTQLMDPDDPARAQLYVKLTGRMQASDHLNIWMRYEQNLYSEMSDSRGSDSPALPNVRTLINRYLVEGDSGIEQLYAEYQTSLSSSLHTRSYIGLLETMYGGVGGEILYAPYKQRWALGVNANVVKQRGFKRDFAFRDYETVTAHVSAYYATPFYDIDLALHAGRYLAKDRGYTFEARRTFDSGFSVGGFFTRTNVSAEDFGEGSFDKGLFFRIPFNGILPGNTRSSFSTILRSLERDGGRRLENFGSTLWFDRRALRYDALDRNLNRMLPK
jgi:hypothetical protein